MEQVFDFKKRRDCRIFAIQQICAYLILQEEPNIFLKNLFENSEFNYSNTYAEILIQKTIANQKESIGLIDAYLKDGWKFKRLESQDQAILLVATYELIKSDIPNKIVINEALEISKEYTYPESRKYINAVLDKISNSK